MINLYIRHYTTKPFLWLYQLPCNFTNWFGFERVTDFVYNYMEWYLDVTYWPVEKLSLTDEEYFKLYPEEREDVKI